MEAGLVVVGIIVAIVVGASLYEFGRRFCYWAGARIYGWSDEEKFRRETAWIDRAVQRDERLAKRDARATADVERRRYGVTLTTIAIGGMAFQLNLPWWESVMIAVAFFVGATMAAGLAWKWW